MTTMFQTLSALLHLLTLSLLLVFVPQPLRLVDAAPPPVQARPTPTALTPHTRALVIGPDGKLPLWDSPARQRVQFEIPIGARVEVQEQVMLAEEQVWYRVRLLDHAGEGWLPAGMVLRDPAERPQILNVRLCGEARRDAGHAACQPPTLQHEALWLRWTYVGLHAGDLVQRVLIVNDQRYQAPPEVWAGPVAGQERLNLREHPAVLKPGHWTVWFIVNGVIVNESVWDVR